MLHVTGVVYRHGQSSLPVPHPRSKTVPPLGYKALVLAGRLQGRAVRERRRSP